MHVLSHMVKTKIGGTVLLLGVLLAILLVSSVALKATKRDGNGNLACTLDVKLCPDGSYVGRMPPRCEFAACPTSSATGTGTLVGKVTVGPMCPVELCPTTLDLFSSKQIILQAGGKTIRIKNLATDGSFSASVPAGTYQLSLSSCEWLGCREALPKTVTIQANKTTEVIINIDTGIR